MSWDYKTRSSLLGSSTQISLFVIPVMVILGWIMDRPMGLQFGVFEVSMAFISSVIVAFVVADGHGGPPRAALSRHRALRVR